MFVACASRTMQGAARIAAQRGGAFPADRGISLERRHPAPAPEAPVDRLVYRPKSERRCADVTLIPTPFAETRRIIDLMARMHGSTFKRVMSGRRTRICCIPRQAAICAVAEFFASKGTKKSLPELGRIFGGLDHTTVLHAMGKRGYRQ